MANYYKMPPLGSPVADSAGVITQAWATLLREFQTGLNAELASGRVQPFWLSAADLADPTKFMQAGANVGKGVGEYLGWAKCDGNDSRPNPGDTFLRFSLTDSAGTTGGSDTQVHSVDVPAHRHGPGNLTAKITMHDGDNTIYGVESTTGGGGVYIANSQQLDPVAAWGPGNVYGTPVFGNTDYADEAPFDSASADNRPAFYSWVPLIRIPVTVTP